MKLTKAIGPALLGTCLFGAVANSYPTNEEKTAWFRARAERTRAPREETVRTVSPAAPRAEACSPRPQWTARGAWDDDFCFEFGEDWSFPFGTNHLAGVLVHSQGGLAASSYDMPFVSLPVPVAIVPGEGSFAVERTASNSCAFVWRNVRPGRTAAETVDARIELFRNGDHCVSTNGVVVGRKMPDNPFPNVPIGQDNEWVFWQFGDRTDILSLGYDAWVDSQVGVGLENGLYKFTASFTVDPPGPTLLEVGNMSVVVTNAGEYVFVLEKGHEYEFETTPGDPLVEYWMQDDLADVPVFANWWWDGGDGDWSVDGGWNWIYCPGQGLRGCCNWMPTLQGSPSITHLGPDDLPITLEAVLTDYCGSELPLFQWSSSDDGVTFSNPNAQTTELNCNNLPSWAYLALSVEANLGGYSLWSSLCPTYGTNTTPQVSLAISAPRAIFVNDDGDASAEGKDCEQPGRHADDDDIVPLTISMRSDAVTSGTLVVRTLIRDGHLWKNANRIEEIRYEERIPVVDATEHEETFYLEGEYASYGYCTDQISVSWEGDTSNDLRAEHDFTVIDCVAEPITTDMMSIDGTDYVVNPCCAIVGERTFMRIKVTPEDVPNDKIAWRVLDGVASFPNGNRGRDVVVVAGGSEGDTVVLEVDIDGCAGSRPRFELLTTEMREVLLYPYLIAGATGAELTETQLAEKLREVNKVYRQVGLHFSAAPIEIVHNYEWSHYGLAKRSVGRAIRNYAHKTDGVEVYFIGSNEEIVDYDAKAIGRANREGVVIRSLASGRVLAHEIGHVCGLADIYIDDNCLEQYHPLRKSWMPSDWNHGTGSRFYAPGKCQLDLIPKLLMYGIGGGNTVDIPMGSVRGLVKDPLSPTGKSLGQAAVGYSTMISFPPHTR